MTTITKAALLSLLLACTASAAPQPGQPAPDFTLADSEGTQHKLSELKGKFIVLEWLNQDCPFVKKHYDSGNMQSLQREYTGREVQWFTIISSAPGRQGHMTPSEAQAHRKAQASSPTAILFDEDGKTGRLYGAKVTPHMFVINPDGILVYAGAIDDHKSADMADIAKAKNYVRQALDEAMSGQPVSHPTSVAYGCTIKYAD